MTYRFRLSLVLLFAPVALLACGGSPTPDAAVSKPDLVMKLGDMTRPGTPVDATAAAPEMAALTDDGGAVVDATPAADLAIPPDLAVPPDLTAPTCTDNIKNGTETDVDCGGSCPNKCAVMKGCAVAADCTTGVCMTNLCVAASCTDMVKNGTETDVDCGGGACPACADTKMCAANSDCSSGVCKNLACAAPSCTDAVKNGTETDVDCGGTCTAKCADGKGCGVGGDCSSGVCTAKTCAVPSCTDTVKNGSETDVDCGGTCATKCADTKGCAVAGDCTSGVCTASKCAAPSCTDAVKNGTETDVDCGGTCAAKCATGKVCLVAADCASAICTGGKCIAAACNDGIQNGTETGQDCGGGCPPCPQMFYDAADARSYPGTGTAWKDLSGNKIDATLVGKTAIGKLGNVPTMVFGGAANPSGAQFANGTLSQTTFTAIYWVYSMNPANQDTNEGGLYVNRPDNSNNSANWVWFGKWSTDCWYFRVDNGSCCNDLTPGSGVCSGAQGSFSTLIPNGQWRMVHFAYQVGATNGWKWGVNGANVSTSTLASRPASMDGTISTIGYGHTGSGSYWNGGIASVRIYNTLVSDADLATMFTLWKSKYGL